VLDELKSSRCGMSEHEVELVDFYKVLESPVLCLPLARQWFRVPPKLER